MLFYYCYLIPCRRSFCRAPSLGPVSRLPWGMQEVTGTAPQGCGVLSQGQGSLGLASGWENFSPPFSASHAGRILLLALPISSLCGQSDAWAKFLKYCSSSGTRQGGNQNLEVLPKYLPRPAYDRYCCPGVGLELGGLDSVPLILMPWIQMQHLFWNKLVVFLLLPLGYITCKWDKDRGSFCGVILKGKAQDEVLEMLVPSRSLHLVNYALNFKEKPNKIPDMRILSVR